MFGLDSISVNFSFNITWLIFGGLIAILYSYFVYRFTIPKISKVKKFFLVAVRILSLILLLVLIFDPVISLKYKEEVEPVNMVFIDNTTSIISEDSSARADKINNLVDRINDSEGKYEYFTFGNNVNPFNRDTNSSIIFSGIKTNYNDVIKYLSESEKNISSALVVSDGILNDGVNPVYSAEKLPFPIYSIGIGDTTSRKDIAIKNVLFNEYIYLETPTVISASILNNSYQNKNVTASLYEGEKLIKQTAVTLSESGNNNIEFEYTSVSPGEKKMSIRVSAFEDEVTTENNRSIFFINVLNNKLKILLIAGAPSSDLKFIKNSLAEDENLEINTITQISADKFLESDNFELKIKQSDILFLIGFPSGNTRNELINQVRHSINVEQKPFFFLLSPVTSLAKLNLLAKELPFTFSQNSSSILEVQPSIVDINHPLLNHNSSDIFKDWNNLPPVPFYNTNLAAKAGTKLIALATVRNIPLEAPLLLTQRLGRRSCIALLSGDIWRWKLQTAAKENDLFDSFISASVKWLNVREDQKQFSVTTDKRLYTLREPVSFSAQVYDESFNPLNNAQVNVELQSDDEKFEITLNSLGSGRYTGTFETNKPGDYQFSAEAKLDDQNIGTDNGKFSIGDIEIEKINPQADFNFLRSLSIASGGDFATIDNYSSIIEDLNSNYKKNNFSNIFSVEYNLLGDERILFLIILLFGIEWFIRKKSGML